MEKVPFIENDAIVLGMLMLLLGAVFLYLIDKNRILGKVLQICSGVIDVLFITGNFKFYTRYRL